MSRGDLVQQKHRQVGVGIGQYSLSERVCSLLLGAMILSFAGEIYADSRGFEAGMMTQGNTPSASQIENALRLGNQFQGMAYRQLKPSSGLPAPPAYLYPGSHYIPVRPVYPIVSPYYYTPSNYYHGYTSPYYPQPVYQLPRRYGR